MINVFILIMDTIDEDNIYLNNIIKEYEYCKTFVTIKMINKKLIILFNNGYYLKSNMANAKIFLNNNCKKICNVILWHGIPNKLEDEREMNIVKLIQHVRSIKDTDKDTNNFEFIESFYLLTNKEKRRHLKIKYNMKNIPDNYVFKYNIRPFVILFPQFHSFEENNLNYYPGFTDINNLDILTKNTDVIYPLYHTHLTPYFCGSNITEYNLTNVDIIKKQIDTLVNYKIEGFAIYYYWFSDNSVKNNHFLMKEVVDLYFSNDIDLKDRKLFFIWANEDWSSSHALSGNSSYFIKNVYNNENLEMNVNNLIKYFNHTNYLKINNKPVLFIHHPWFMSNEELKLLTFIFNKICILHNFDGIELVLNSMFQEYPSYKQYYHNINYKWNSKNTECKYYYENYSKHVIDYSEYIADEMNHFKDNQINVYYTDFDNSARLIKPNKINLSTYVINNTDLNKQIFLDKISNTYENKEGVNQILLLNALNEWGERLLFEPSNEYGYYNLNLLKNIMIPSGSSICSPSMYNAIVLSGGKCGGSTLNSTLLHNNFKSLHTHGSHHFINWKRKDILNADNLFSFIDKNSMNQKLYIFNIYRPSFERKISGLFQALDSPNDYNKIFSFPKIENTTLEELFTFFKNDLLYGNFENYEPLKEIIHHCNIDSSSICFNHDEKYGLIEKGNISVILLRFKDIKLWETILRNILKQDISLNVANLSENKSYYNLYVQFKEKILKEKIFFEYYEKELIKDKYINIFYTKDDIDELIKHYNIENT